MAQDTSLNSTIMLIRIISADYYLAAPVLELKDPCYSEFRSNTVYRVPVIRIFGSSSEGVKSCVHIHGVFPYIFLPNWASELLDRDLYHLATTLDKAINMSLGNSMSNSQHVYKITQVCGRPFYGYYSDEKQFLKIFFYNPVIAKRAADLLQNGAVYNKSFQPHEAHIPFVLQFFIDNNLYGMSFVKFSSFTTRQENQHKEIEESGICRQNGIYSSVQKQSYSELEYDVLVSDILNIRENAGKISNNPGLAFIWEEERNRRIVQEKSSQFTPNVSQLRPVTESTRTEVYFKEKLKQKLIALHDESREEIISGSSVINRSFSSTDKDVNEAIANVSQMNSSINVSYNEFNSQGRIVFNLLENLIRTSGRNSQPICQLNVPEYLSGSSNASIEYSQPILVPFAEEDSVLGTRCSSDDDSDIDQNDHVVHSQPYSGGYDDPNISLQTNKHITSYDHSNGLNSNSDNSPINKDVIPQLDGLYDSSSDSEENENIKKNLQKLKTEIRTSSTELKTTLCATPLKSKCVLDVEKRKKKLFRMLSPPPSPRSIKPEPKSSPKRVYPQLKVTISPKKIVNENMVSVIQSSSSSIETTEMKLKLPDNKDMKCIGAIQKDEANCLIVESNEQSVSQVGYCENTAMKRFYEDEILSSDDSLLNKDKSTSISELVEKLDKHKRSRKIFNFNEDFASSSTPKLVENESKWKRRKRKKQTKRNSIPQLIFEDSNSSLEDLKVISNDDNSCQCQPECKLPLLETFGDVTGQTSSTFFSDLNCTTLPKEEETLRGTCIQSSFPKVKVWTPTLKPPTYDEVAQILKDQNKSLVPNKEPFYSNPSDVTVGQEICRQMVKVKGNFVSELEEFQSFVENSLESVRCYIFRNACDLSQVHNISMMVSERVVAIAPLKKPPTFLDAVHWLKLKEQLKCDDVLEKLPRKLAKISIPCSPNASYLSYDMNEIILSPESCSLSDESTDILQTTPQADPPSQSPTVSPILRSKKFDLERSENKKLLDLFQIKQEIKCLLPTAKETNECSKKIQPKSGSEQDHKLSEEKPNSDNLLHRLLLNSQLRNNSINNSHNSVSPSFRIDSATPDNTCGFQMDLENLQDIKNDMQYQYITVMSLEVFTLTRGDLKPDPEYDSIKAIFYSIHSDAPNMSNIISGVIIVDDAATNIDFNKFHAKFVFVKDEIELFDSLVYMVRKWDPDMLAGFEIEMLSWGFLIQRGKIAGRNLDIELSRIKGNQCSNDGSAISNDFEFEELRMVGRIILNVWRLLRHEINLQSYTFENLLYHILHQRVPCHSFASLTAWWNHSLCRWIVIDYYLLRTECTLQLLEHLDFLGRTSELARLFGIQFYEVLSRGSQFRVESMMLRIAKPQNYVAVSPTVQQRARMRAPESLPLIMEPESKFYSDPVIVLDFQSLYPSMIIAYNYCFSTCIGRVQYLGQSEPYDFGCLQHSVPLDVLEQLQENLNISPCGVAFVNKTIQTGVLPAMLDEILNARLLVKKSMKENKDNKILQRVLHSRQLGLKLIANVTYGYTSANFSGRMPCIEVGDSVVSKGRETLERAIQLVSKTEKWKAKVIYGDTDSIFVLVPGRTKKEAFQIGNEIADAVTNSNPKPVKLKLEKIYQPCILQTKKRYVGYMYESIDQEKPVYNAKGIETVRRDGCPAVAKMLEKCLKLLFDTCDISLVKRYVQRQFSKLVSGRISIQDLTFAREYRGMREYKPGACVPALNIAREAISIDRRAEPRVKERIRYVIIAGLPGEILIKLVRTPEQFLADDNLKINFDYYISRAIIPALDRCFSLLGINVSSWYAELPRKQFLYLPSLLENDTAKKKGTISQYFPTSSCIVCHKICCSGLCEECLKKPHLVAITIGNKMNTWERKYNYTRKLCQSCCGHSFVIECISLDCPILYSRLQCKRDADQIPYVEELQRKYLDF